MKKLAQIAVCLTVAVSAAGCFGYERNSTPTAPVRQHRITGRQLDLVQSHPVAELLRRLQVEHHRADRQYGQGLVQRDLRQRSEADRHGTRHDQRLDHPMERHRRRQRPGLANCQVSLTGTAEIGITTVRVPYSGDTCLGKVSGVSR
jgi:hypothetical protein